MQSHVQALFRHQVREAQKSGTVDNIPTAAMFVDSPSESQKTIDIDHQSMKQQPNEEEDEHIKVEDNKKEEESSATIDDWLATEKRKVTTIKQEEENMNSCMMTA